MKTFRKLTLSIAAIAVWLSMGSMSYGKPSMHPSQHAVLTAEDLKWGPAPSALPVGAKAAILEGNPMAAGPFTLRLMVPSGYKIPPHWHSGDEHVTVISGTFHIGSGATFDKTKGKAMPAGSFAFMPAGMKHYAWADEDTVIQLHGIGPWSIHYINPTDDPRNTKTGY